jgi:hypothetical protein
MIFEVQNTTERLRPVILFPICAPINGVHRYKKTTARVVSLVDNLRTCLLFKQFSQVVLIFAGKFSKSKGDRSAVSCTL